MTKLEIDLTPREKRRTALQTMLSKREYEAVKEYAEAHEFTVARFMRLLLHATLPDKIAKQ